MTAMLNKSRKQTWKKLFILFLNRNGLLYRKLCLLARMGFKILKQVIMMHKPACQQSDRIRSIFDGMQNFSTGLMAH